MMTKNKNKKKLWWLQKLGLDVWNKSSKEWSCTCPFCGDDDHLYLDSIKLLFHCKKCDESGGYTELMSQLALNLAEDLITKRLDRLAKDRLLPVAAFKGYDFGWTGTLFTLPIRDFNDNVVNVLRYKLDGKLLAAPGCKQGLFNAQLLADTSRKKEPVYITEGPWDAIALDWLRRKAKKPGIVTAVQGAGQLPKDILTYFRNRNVYIIQDADEAGSKGEARIGAMLKGVAKSIRYYRWDKNQSKGMDSVTLVETLDFDQKTEVVCPNGQAEKRPLTPCHSGFGPAHRHA